ncbi:MAG TPA: DNA methyltransferase [Tepidisphaeraceae bacterium]|jgi:DNA modification methylase|nr:DNA methyltransferase [Tepidisphaeraceae bacterium]
MGQPPNTLYYGDNLDILRRYIDDESVDLIYLDPPFNSNADYNVLFAEKDGTQAHAQIKAFGDTWTWDLEAAQEYAEVLRSGHDRIARALKGIHDFLGGSDMLAYLSMMALRLIELRRVLKPTGSIYLHCDPTASHYLKMIMDAVFGPDQMRGEIVWKRTSAHGNATGNYAGVHDLIFFYAKGPHPTWNRVYQPYDEAYIAEHFVHKDPDGRVFRRVDMRNPGYRPNLVYDYKGYKPHPNGWAVSKEKMEQLDREGRLFFPKKGVTGRIRRKIYLEDSPGVPITDVWTDIRPIHAAAAERLGYPTQKPEALLERIIAASSNEGNVVLDPFCGCGTAIAAAQKLKRRWIGIDITHLSINLIKVRLADAFGAKIVQKYKVIGEPTDLQGARALAAQDKYQFQYWALGLVGARPAQRDEKKGADKGIDGRLYMTDRDGETTSIIISVKGGHATVSQVRDLRGVIEREGAAIGVFITLEPATAPMRKEAADAGFWQYTGIGNTKHPRLQILTIEELLAGKRIDMPAQQDIRSFKQAPKAKGKKPDDARLF